MTSRAPVIEISNVWKLHKLGDEVVKALVAADLTVMPGEFVCLMGPSGSGKSTLLNMIGGLDRPTKGTIKVAGTRYRRPSPRASSPHCATTPSGSSSRATT